MTSLSSPPVAGVWLSSIHLIGYMTLSPLHCSWCVVSAYTWLALCLSLLSTCSWCGWAHTLDWLYVSLSSLTCSWCVVERIHLIGSMSLSLLSTCSWCVHTLDWLYDLSPLHPSWCGWAHTLDWLYDSLSLSAPLAGVWWAYTWLALWLSLLSTCSWCVARAYTWLAIWLSLPLHL